MAQNDTQEQTGLGIREKLQPPSMYKVILLNDDYTPMDFVIHVLKKFFNKTEAEAYDIMIQVHTQGSGVAGVFSYEIAEMKSAQVNMYARKNEHPLKSVIEKDG